MEDCKRFEAVCVLASSDIGDDIKPIEMPDLVVFLFAGGALVFV